MNLAIKADQLAYDSYFAEPRINKSLDNDLFDGWEICLDDLDNVASNFMHRYR